MKKELIKKAFLFLCLPLYTPLLIPLFFTDYREFIRGDLVRWLKVWQRDVSCFAYDILFACIKSRVFLSIYLHRLKCGNLLGWVLSQILSRIYRPLTTLQIDTKDIGPGLFIQHGLCTIISAKKIGNNAWVRQGVTIGYIGVTDCPVIGDNVRVGAGAKILGNIVIGDNVDIGANAVVVKSVPKNTTVVGVPARIVRRDGRRVSVDLVK